MLAQIGKIMIISPYFAYFLREILMIWLKKFILVMPKEKKKKSMSIFFLVRDNFISLEDLPNKEYTEGGIVLKSYRWKSYAHVKELSIFKCITFWTKDNRWVCCMRRFALLTFSPINEEDVIFEACNQITSVVQKTCSIQSVVHLKLRHQNLVLIPDLNATIQAKMIEIVRNMTTILKSNIDLVSLHGRPGMISYISMNNIITYWK